MIPPDDVLDLDILLTADGSTASKVICDLSGGPCSHAAPLIRLDGVARLVEPTFKSYGKPTVNRLSDRLREYARAPGGCVWQLRLADPLNPMEAADLRVRLLDWVSRGDNYSLFGAMASAFACWTNRRGKAGRFCSSLCARELRHFGRLPLAVNCNEVTPINLPEADIWAWCKQLVGEPTELPQLNSVPLSQFAWWVTADRKTRRVGVWRP